MYGRGAVDTQGGAPQDWSTVLRNVETCQRGPPITKVLEPTSIPGSDTLNHQGPVLGFLEWSDPLLTFFPYLGGSVLCTPKTL